VHDGSAWLEARSTAPDVLGDLPLPWGTPADDDERHAAIFSVVVDDPSKRVRELPSLYHGNAQIYASRDIADVRQKLAATVSAVLESSSRAWYLASACRVGNRFGLYARDVCNRDPFRMRTARAGLVISDDPHVRMTDDGSFTCEGWPSFQPTFIVVNPRRDAEARNLNEGASLTFLFGILRLGAMTAPELRHVVQMVKTADIVDADDPDDVVERLEADNV
jgi:hypothetical protein